MNRLKYFWLFLLPFFCTSLAGQGWERYYNFTPPNNAGRKIYPTPDGGFFVKNIDLRGDITIPDHGGAYLKTDFQGNVQNYRSSNCIDIVEAYRSFFGPLEGFVTAQLSTGEIASFGATRVRQTPLDTIQKLELTDLYGDQIWCKDIPIGRFSITDAEGADDGNLFVAGEIGFSAGIRKIDLEGSIIWENRLSGAFNGAVIRAANDGGVLLITFLDSGELGNGAHLYRFDADGNQLWSNFIGSFPRRFTKPVFGNHNIYFGGNYSLSGGGSETRVFKLDTVGGISDQYVVPANDPTIQEEGFLFDLEVNDQDEVLVGRHFEHESSQLKYPYRFSITKLDSDMEPVFEHEFYDLFSHINTNGSEFLNGMDIEPLPDGCIAVTGTRMFFFGNEELFLFKIDSLGNTRTNQISGKIALDLNDNCQLDPTDSLVNIPHLMQLIRGTDTLTFSSLSDGSFSIRTDIDTYELRLLSNSPLWAPCQNSFIIDHQTAYDTANIDLMLTPLVECHSLSVDVGSTRLRTCGSTNYTVSYCNEGTVEALDAYVEIHLPPELSLRDSDIPGIDLGGNVWRFELGTLELFNCDNFRFRVITQCDNSIVNQTLCVEAKIFPDTLCLPPSPMWSRASLDVTGECQGDSLIFNIKNVGNGDMLDTKQYIVIEDIAVMRIGNPFQLPAGESIRVPIEATGAAIRLEVPQPDEHPYAERASATLEFCGNPPFTSGLFNQLGHNSGNPSSAIYCSQVLNGYDPNEKLASPTGFRSEHEIYADQVLDYEIHFQNTGNDTAFRVVLLDTLSTNLDLTTLRVGASNHDFEWDIFDDKILRFTFENIGLVDSFTNEPGSQGFVKYSIKAKEGLPVATRINNSADIYFDFNAPIKTNQTFHTIGFTDFDNDGFSSVIDCDDQNPNINSGATEIPNNNIDEDCDGIAQIIDEDMDGFNSDEDCDDANSTINPNATEIPNNAIDEDCDGIAQIIDEDMDGFNSDEDCDDANSTINPNATEIPNNTIDEDCDGIALIIDEDMDGFNSDDDCDDANSTINPNATEIPNNAIDEDCDGIAQIIDEDMDGFNSDEDCDDANATINPNATEIPNNAIDEDCDGIALIIDEDMDGFNSDDDCDDTNPDVNPDAIEIPNNGIDDNCDGIELITTSATEIYKNAIKVYPNPFENSTRFELLNEAIGTKTFKLSNISGQEVHLQKFDASAFIFERGRLNSGIYFYKISNEDSIIAIGKVIIQ